MKRLFYLLTIFTMVLFFAGCNNDAKEKEQAKIESFDFAAKQVHEHAFKLYCGCSDYSFKVQEYWERHPINKLNDDEQTMLVMDSLKNDLDKSVASITNHPAARNQAYDDIMLVVEDAYTMYHIAKHDFASSYKFYQDWQWKTSGKFNVDESLLLAKYPKYALKTE